MTTSGEATPPASQHGQESHSPTEDRAVAPLRWPHPDAFTLSYVLLWVVGMIVAIFVPALIVSPGAHSAPAGKVWTAFGTTCLGAVIMLLASFGLFRRSRHVEVMTLGSVPAASVVIGGIILVATKLSGTNT